MRFITITSIILFSINLFAQDLIATKDSNIIEANINIIKNDTIMYFLHNDSVKKLHSILKTEIIGIKYENGSVFETKDSKISLSRALISYLRINKKGWYIGISINACSVENGFYEEPIIDDNYFAASFNDDGYSFHNSITGNYFHNNIIGLSFGLGYSYIEHNIYQNISEKPTNYNPDNKYLYDLPVYSTIEQTNFIESAVIPIKLTIMPGNIIGVYADFGATFFVPFNAKYYRKYTNLSTGNIEVERKNFIRDIPLINVVFGASLGLHYQITEKMFFYAAVTANESFGKFNYALIGGKIGVSYRIHK